MLGSGLLIAGVGLIAAALGLMLVAWLRRGPRVLLCARCAYDLSGVVEGVALKADACPECGRGLHELGATRRHRPRRGVRRAALASLAAGAVLLTTHLVMNSPALNTRKPSWLLVAQARLWPAQHAELAARELIRRVDAGTEVPGVLDALKERALREATGPGPGWRPPEWVDILTRMVSSGTLTTEQRGAVLTAYLLSANEVRDQGVLSGQAWPPNVIGDFDPFDLQQFRTSGGIAAMLPRRVGATLDGMPWPTEPAEYAKLTRVQPGSTRMSTVDVSEYPHGPTVRLLPRVLPPGTHRVELRFETDLWLFGAREWSGPIDSRLPEVPPHMTRVATVTVQITVAEDPARLFKLVRPIDVPESQRPDIRVGQRLAGGFNPAPIYARPRRDIADPGFVVNFQLTEPLQGPGPRTARRFAVAAKVWLRVGDAEYPVSVGTNPDGSLNRASVTVRHFDPGAPVGGFVLDMPRAPAVDVILRPDYEVAAQAKVTELWDHPIVIPNVPMDYSAMDAVTPSTE